MKRNVSYLGQKRIFRQIFVVALLVFGGWLEGIAQSDPYQLIVPDLPTKDLTSKFLAKVGNKLYFVSDKKFYSLEVASGVAEEITVTEPGSFSFDGDIASIGDKILIGNYISYLSGGIEPIAYDTSSETFEVLKDINTSGNSNPASFYSNGAYIYFIAYNGSSYRLWRTDGTSDGTIELSTVNFSNVVKYTSLGSSTFIIDRSTGSYQKLYISDGSAENTTLLKDFSQDLDPGFFRAQYEPNYPVENTSITFVIARSSSREVWFSDGTVDNTRMLFSIDNNNGYLDQLAVYQGDLYYQIYTNNSGELDSWLMKYDFSSEVTEEVKSFPGNYLGEMHATADFLIVTVGNSLWVSDGTDVGTTLLASDLVPFNRVKEFSNLSNGNVLIKGYNSETGNELWITDGTTTGTSVVKDIYPGPTNSIPSILDNAIELFENDILYFLADSPENGLEFWVSDGTPEGTILIADVNSSRTEPSISDYAQNENYLVAEIYGASNTITHLLEKSSTEFEKVVRNDGVDFRPNQIIELSGTIYFTHFSEPKLYSINQSGGLSTIDFQVSSEMVSISSLYKVGNKLIFTAATPGTPPLVEYKTYLSNGTPEGTFPVGEFFIGSQWFPESFGILNEYEILLDGADFLDNNIFGSELRKIDLNSLESSVLKDIVPGQGSSNPNNFIKYKNHFYFLTSDESDEYHTRYLWKTDGTENGTMLVYDFGDGDAYRIFTLDEVLVVLVADVYGSNQLSLWKSDGTQEGTNLLESIGEHYVFGNLPHPFPVIQGDGYILYMIYQSSGVFDIAVLNQNFEETILLADKTALRATWKRDNLLFFITADGELYRTDGTGEGTVLISDYFSSSNFSQINGYASFDDLAIINIARDNVKEIWAQSIFYSDIEVKSGISAVASGASYDFGTTTFDTEAATTYSFTLKNNGLINLNFGKTVSSSVSGTHAADFTIKNATFENSIAPDQEGTIAVYFKPRGTGTRTATLTFNTNDEDTPTFTIVLTGQATKSSQSITFAELPDKTFGDDSFELVGSASSGLPMSYTSSNNEILTIEGKVATILKTGKVTITASQPGNENYEAATTIERTLTVNKAPQTISFPAIEAKTFGTPPFDLSATTSAGLAVTFSSSDPSVASIEGKAVTILKVGTATITASQAGNDNYGSATATQTLTVNKAPQTITFPAIEAKTFGDAAFALAASSTSGLAVTLSSSNEAVATISDGKVTILKAGSTAITASQVGNDNYLAAEAVAQTLTINKAQQSVAFEPLPNATFGDLPVQLTASSSAGLPVTFSSSDPAVASVDGASLSILKAGSVTVTATQAGNDNYAAASAAQVLTVNKAAQTIAFGELPSLTTSDESIPLSAEASSGLPVTFSSSDETVATVEGDILTVVGGGETTITASQEGDENYLAADNVSSTLVVEEVTGVGNELAGMIKVYPNPVNNLLVISHKDLEKGAFTITSIAGELISSGELNKGGLTSIQTSGLREGIYLLSVSANDIKLVYRVIKEN